MWLASTLHDWHEFYVLLGTAAATLLALLFVALTVGAGYLRPELAGGTRTFMSPVVIHFATVLFISLLALVPPHRGMFFVALIGATALIGIVVGIVVTVQVVSTKLAGVDTTDRFAYGLLPAAGYAAVLTSAALMSAEIETGLDILAGGLLLLLMVNIRNAWDLTLAMVLKHAENPDAN